MADVPSPTQLPPLSFSPGSSDASLATPSGATPRTTPPPLPRRTAMAPRAALRALLHTPLEVNLHDGRILQGNLTAIDSSGALLLSMVREYRTLPATPVGDNVARYYPYSRDGAGGDGDGGPAGGDGSGGHNRVRELASVLVPMAHITGVQIDNESARAWGAYTGVDVADGAAVVSGLDGAASAAPAPVPAEA